MSPLIQRSPAFLFDQPPLTAAEVRGVRFRDMSLAELIGWLDRRVHSVEQITTSPGVMGDPPPDDGIFPDGIIIGAEGDPEAVWISLVDPDPPTAPDIVQGSIYNELFAQFSWTPPADSTVDVFSYDVHLTSAAGAVFEGAWRTGGTSFRFGNLEPNTEYEATVASVTPTGRTSPTANITFTTGTDTTIPPQVTGVVVTRGATSVVVSFTPITDAEARDVANGNGLYEIEVDTANTFSTGNLRNARTGDQVFAFNDVTAEGSWYARVRAIDSSGNAGAWSTTAGPVTAGGVIDAMVVADLSAAKITAGFLSASRIQAGTLTADKLTTSSLTTADITLDGGSIRAGSPPTTGVLINSQGIRGYASSVTTFILDATTGAASFSGSISASTIAASTITGGSISGSSFQTALTGAHWYISNTLEGSGPTGIAFIHGYTNRTGSDYSPARIATQWNAGVGGTFYAGDTLTLSPPRPQAASGHTVVHLSSYEAAGFGEISLSADIGSSGLAYSNTYIRIGGSYNAPSIYSGGVSLGGGQYGVVVNGALNASNGYGTFGTHSLYPLISAGNVSFYTRDSGGTLVHAGTLANGSYSTHGGFCKTFVIPHPIHSERYLVHACIEGPEAAVYCRGEGYLSFGVAYVELPDYFEALTEVEGRTVQVTPIAGEGTCENLRATRPHDGRFTVFGSESGKFFWEVKAVRKNTPVEVEPLKRTTDVRGTGPYTYVNN